MEPITDLSLSVLHHKRPQPVYGSDLLIAICAPSYESCVGTRKPTFQSFVLQRVTFVSSNVLFFSFDGNRYVFPNRLPLKIFISFRGLGEGGWGSPPRSPPPGAFYGGCDFMRPSRIYGSKKKKGSITGSRYANNTSSPILFGRAVWNRSEMEWQMWHAQNEALKYDTDFVVLAKNSGNSGKVALKF